MSHVNSSSSSSSSSNNNNNNNNKQKKILSMALIDYQKAFDRVPHSWIIKSLELIGINNKVIAFTKKATTYWRTRMRLHVENELIETRHKNTMWDISRRLTVTIAILHLFDSSY